MAASSNATTDDDTVSDPVHSAPVKATDLEELSASLHQLECARLVCPLRRATTAATAARTALW